jgi:proteic killer suppression protein
MGAGRKGFNPIFGDRTVHRYGRERGFQFEIILDRLNAATDPRQMNAPGLRFHVLSGDMHGRFAVNVSTNWRITFGWSDKDAVEVDLEDYH